MTLAAHSATLVETGWLADHLGAPDVKVVDGSWHMPDAQRNGAVEYETCHIPGAVFFDIDEIKNTETTLPHMLPDPAKFSSRVRALGLGDGHRIVVYDTAGMFSAARVWWMFRVMGHGEVFVLNGGLPKWRSEGRAIEDLPPVTGATPRHFTTRQHDMMVRGIKAVAEASTSGREQIIDARSPARFTGTEADPRPGVRPGHIPGSLNVHYRSLLNDDGTMKSSDALRAVFTEAGMDWSRPVIASCGSGVTAAIIVLALTQLGHPAVSLYDGAWAEWGANPDYPAATGPSQRAATDVR